MAIVRLNPAPPETTSHDPGPETFPKLDCPNFYVPLDKIYEITTVLSAAPKEAIDCVDIVFARPPALAFDIPNPLASEPAEAVDIPNPPAPGPAAAVDIPNPPLGAPADAVDIPNPPSLPPADGPPVTPGPSEYETTFVDSTDQPDLVPPRLPPGTDIRRHPPLGQEADTTQEQFTDELPVDCPEHDELRFPGGYLDPRDDINLQAHLLDPRIKLALDAVEEGLSSLNPLNLIKLGRQLSVSGLQSAVAIGPIRVPLPFEGGNHSEKIKARDPSNNVTPIQGEMGQEAIEQNNLYSPSAPYNNAHEAWGSGEARPLFDLEELNDASKSTDNNALFNIKKASLSIKKEARTRTPKNLDKQATFFGAGRKPGGQIPQRFENDRDDGSIITKNDGESPHDIISDNEAYVPLSFTDLRPLNDGGSFRSVYFRPFITSLTEDFSPEWDKKTLYGRTDQVVNYMSTVRTIFVGFELHAFYPDDLAIMYKKLQWLSSLVYPEYDRELLLKSGPVCRMRVGDVISGANKQGLSGIIDSLSFDYTDSIWEIKEGQKAPRSIKVSISFHALHEVPIGRNSIGDFGGLSTTPSSLREVRVPGADHNWGSSSVVKTKIDHDITANGGFFRGIGSK